MNARGFVIAIALSVSCGAAALPQTGPRGGDRGTARHGDLLLSLARHSVQALDLPDGGEPPSSFEFSLEIDGQPVTISLTRRSMRGPDFQVLEDHGGGRLVPVDAGPVRTYRGIVVEQPEARVTAHLRADGSANVRIAFADVTWYAEPIPHATRQADGIDHIVYRTNDLLTPAGRCGVSGLPIDPPGGGGGGGFGPRGGEPEFWRAQIAFDADYEYYDEYGSTSAVIAAIESNMIDAEDIYEDQVAMCYEITTIVVRTSEDDPYSDEDDANPLLDEFQAHWRANFSSVPRTAAHLMTGKDLVGSTIGLAFTSGINCINGSWSDVVAYGLQEDISGQARRVELCCHEVGHNWGACHCDLEPCVIVDPCGIMTSFVDGRDFFSDFSQSQIEGRMDSEADCLVPCGCGFTIFVPEHFPLLLAIQGAGTVCGSTVSIRFGTYQIDSPGRLETSSGETVRLTARGGLVRIERQ